MFAIVARSGSGRDAATAVDLLDDALDLGPKEDSVRYSIYKNRGWAYFGLGTFGEANDAS